MLKVRLLLFSMALLINLKFSNAQAPVIQWQKTYGGTNTEGVFDLQLTNDQGCIILGITNSSDIPNSNYHGAFDYWILKLDSTGDLEWQKCYGGSGYDYPTSIKQTSDAGYIITGYTQSSDGDIFGYKGGLYDAWVIRLDSTGALRWQRCYGGSNSDFAMDVLELDSGKFLIYASSYSLDDDVAGRNFNETIWLIKIDSTGSILNNYFYGQTAGEACCRGRLINTLDGGYAIISWKYNPIGGSKNYLLFKLDSNLTMDYFLGYGGSQDDVAIDGIQSDDGGFVLIGKARSVDGWVPSHFDQFYGNLWVLKVDQSGGTPLIRRTLGGGRIETAECIQQTQDQGFLISVNSESFDGDLIGTGQHSTFGISDWWLIKLDSNGATQWSKCYGGTSIEDEGRFKIKTNGDIVFSGVACSIDGDVSSWIHNNFLGDIWIGNLVAGPNEILNISFPFQEFSAKISTFQNKLGLRFFMDKPFELEFKVLDLRGRVITVQKFTPQGGINYKTFDLPEISQGIYFVQLGDGVNFQTVKVMAE